MKIARIKLNVIFIVLALCAVHAPIASAAHVWVAGKITRTLTDAAHGGCMVHLDVQMPAPCPASGWVSLDCDGAYYDAIDGNNKFSSVLTALSLDRNIGVYVNDEIRHNGYCVARRVDILGY